MHVMSACSITSDSKVLFYLTTFQRTSILVLYCTFLGDSRSIPLSWGPPPSLSLAIESSGDAVVRRLE